MLTIQKKIVTDESQQPIAVQIDYADWLEIERLLGVQVAASRLTDLSRHEDVLQLTEDPLKYQDRIRSEWS